MGELAPKGLVSFKLLFLSVTGDFLGTGEENLGGETWAKEDTLTISRFR
jgi:hypothetical protein